MLLRFFPLVFVLAFLGAGRVHAQEIPPKREFRAAWICTLANLDWPSKPGMSSHVQQREYIDMVDMMQSIGMNALMVQVRPAGDALYPSELVPWTQYLSGKQGMPPSPYYDPLAFMVEETHARNLEFHAWFNPFRALSSIRLSSVALDNPINHHPEWVFDYGESKYFDPGIPAVRAYLVQVVMEVVNKYDIDGIHLDDYFYPYPIEGQPIPDDRSYRLYGQGFKSRETWRRANIDAFISQLADSIFLTKPWVKFGVSPFGVWRGTDQDERGSKTSRTFTTYDGIYADTRKWLESGWVDYMAPQLYWSIAHSRAPFEVLLDWWSNLGTNRHIYIGHGVYMLQHEESPKWVNINEYLQQVRLCRSDNQVCGSIWFRANTLQENTDGIRTLLDRQIYPYPALPPVMPWIDSIPPLRPKVLNLTQNETGIYLDWEEPAAAEDGDVPLYYLVYRFKGDDPIKLDDPRNIVGIRRATYFHDEKAIRGQRYTYVVTSVDRIHNESTRYVHASATFGEAN